jgi:hypothetical protein
MESSAPAWVSWTGLGLAVAAIVLALPPIFQMFFGRPKLVVTFETAPVKQGIQLRCNIQNLAISKWLQRIGSYRAPTNISAIYEIFEFGTNKQILGVTRPKLYFQGKTVGRNLELGFSIEPAVFNIVVHYDNKEPPIALTDDPSNIGVPLLPGRYYSKVNVISSHQQLKAISHEFIVGKSPDQTGWSQQNF